ncbi:MAG: tyrosine--tRNA ligase [Treponema sp.]|jgi:tyrosyl-tRNA synthetase|nr:tyrosine--tRNA ligase [Treponema sp.]
MNKTLERLKSRGFFQQCTDVEKLSLLMDQGPIVFYEGCDPTGPSLHIGHMAPYFAMRHLVEAGHKAIVLIGGGTARIGDPSGKTTMRKMLSYEQLDENAASIARQINRFFAALPHNAAAAITYENNKTWLANLNYIDFLREIGSHFSVNRMLSFESYKMRLESDAGLSFIEFNYQLLQSYDFYQLYKRYGCRLQIGGNDQWGNITAGADLIRRLEWGGESASADGASAEAATVFGLTFPLVTTADGKKMGKTEKGAVFLDPNITAPYDFFQYWRNVQDADVRRFLLMFTFLPLEECDALVAPDKNPNQAKERLAWEVTALIHGADEADKALSGARASFGGAGGDKAAMPSVRLARSKFETGYNIVDLFCDARLCATKSEARRMVQQGGACVGSQGAFTAVTDVAATVGADKLDEEGELTLRAGKKRFCRVASMSDV